MRKIYKKGKDFWKDIVIIYQTSRKQMLKEAEQYR